MNAHECDAESALRDFRAGFKGLLDALARGEAQDGRHVALRLTALEALLDALHFSFVTLKENGRDCEAVCPLSGGGLKRYLEEFGFNEERQAKVSESLAQLSAFVGEDVGAYASRKLKLPCEICPAKRPLAPLRREKPYS